MMGSRLSDRDAEVTCIACGADLPRSDAREYDKHGDRWDREGKAFEYLCKPCDKARCHQPRDGIEAALVDIERAHGDLDRDEFLAEFLARTGGAVEER